MGGNRSRCPGYSQCDAALTGNAADQHGKREVAAVLEIGGNDGVDLGKSVHVSGRRSSIEKLCCSARNLNCDRKSYVRSGRCDVAV